MLHSASSVHSGATVMAYRVSDPSRYGVVEFDAAGRAITIEEKPAVAKFYFAVTGFTSMTNASWNLLRTFAHRGGASWKSPISTECTLIVAI